MANAMMRMMMQGIPHNEYLFAFPNVPDCQYHHDDWFWLVSFCQLCNRQIESWRQWSLVTNLCVLVLTKSHKHLVWNSSWFLRFHFLIQWFCTCPSTHSWKCAVMEIILRLYFFMTGLKFEIIPTRGVSKRQTVQTVRDSRTSGSLRHTWIVSTIS